MYSDAYNDSRHALPILDAYATAVYARDVDALLALYHPDVTVYDM